jgi:hypothetical protein
MKRGSDSKRSRPSTSGWEKSLSLADEAFDLAVKATSQALSGDVSSNSVAEVTLSNWQKGSSPTHFDW